MTPSQTPLAAGARDRGSPHDMARVLAEIEDRIQQIERQAVFEYLTRNPGARAAEIATGLGTGREAVSAHLSGGKGELFSNRDGSWFPIPAADPGGSGMTW